MHVHFEGKARPYHEWHASPTNLKGERLPPGSSIWDQPAQQILNVVGQATSINVRYASSSKSFFAHLKDSTLPWRPDQGHQPYSIGFPKPGGQQGGVPKWNLAADLYHLKIKPSAAHLPALAKALQGPHVDVNKALGRPPAWKKYNDLLRSGENNPLVRQLMGLFPNSGLEWMQVALRDIQVPPELDAPQPSSQPPPLEHQISAQTWSLLKNAFTGLTLLVPQRKLTLFKPDAKVKISVLLGCTEGGIEINLENQDILDYLPQDQFQV